MDPAVRRLARGLDKLELHAARSGRETLAALIAVVSHSKKEDLRDVIEEVRQSVLVLLKVLPPYTPALNSINRVLNALQAGLDRQEEAAGVLRKLRALEAETTRPAAVQEKIARHLLSALPLPSVVYTHTLSETVLAVLGLLSRAGRLRSVIVTESRPNNDGWITATNSARQKVNVELMLDASVADAAALCDLMLAGTELIQPDGSAVCKVGTFPAAAFCKQRGKPVYIVAATNKLSAISWNNLASAELSARALGLERRPPRLHVAGSYFDRTPADLITGYATELGILRESELTPLVERMEVSPWLMSQAGNPVDTRNTAEHGSRRE